MKVFNRVQSFFPNGILLDTSGNCFNLFMEFPTTDGAIASVLIWEEGVTLYDNNGEYLRKEDYHKLNEDLFVDSFDESFRNHEVELFSLYDIEFDDDDNEVTLPNENKVFDTNTMIEIGKTWEKYRRCFFMALQGK